MHGENLKLNEIKIRVYQGSSSPSVHLLFSALKNNLWGHRFEDIF